MRAGQNVIWEFGFFVGILGRNKVCCLYKEGVTPSLWMSQACYTKELEVESKKLYLQF